MSTEHQEASEPQTLAWDGPGAGTARGPVRRAIGLAARHKVISGTVAVFAVAVIVVSVLTTSPASRSYPAAPGFTVAALSHPGAKISLSEFKGKPLVVNFWASWCEPCQKEAPLLASWYRQHHGQVIVVGLDENDNAAKALAFAHAKGMSYPIGFDPAMHAASAYDVGALPQTFFLNAQHRIVGHLLGGVTKAKLANGLRLMDGS